MLVEVDVTDREIEQGQPGKCYFCAVALALAKSAQALDPTGGARVTRDDMEMFVKGIRYVSPLPRIVEVFIENYDCGGPVGPIKFTASFVPSTQ